MKVRFLFFVCFFLCIVSMGAAYPHAFEGTIVVIDESNPHDYTLTAQLNEVAVETGIIEHTFFGAYEGTNLSPFIVSDFVETSGIIEFYICGEKAAETFDFTAFEKTVTNLTFQTIPSPQDPSCNEDCGDAICQIGECTSCPADCSVNLCKGDGYCDDSFGETCETVPEDCGVCPEPPQTSGGGSGGGGGGGSSGGSSQLAPVTSEGESEAGQEVSIVDVSETSEDTESEERIVEEQSREEETGFFSWITGNVIGTTDSYNGLWIGGIGFFALLGMYLLYRTKKHTP